MVWCPRVRRRWLSNDELTNHYVASQVQTREARLCNPISFTLTAGARHQRQQFDTTPGYQAQRRWRSCRSICSPPKLTLTFCPHFTADTAFGSSQVPCDAARWWMSAVFVEISYSSDVMRLKIQHLGQIRIAIHPFIRKVHIKMFRNVS